MKDYFGIGRSLKESGATATPRLPNWQSQQKIDAGFSSPKAPPLPPPPRDTTRR